MSSQWDELAAKAENYEIFERKTFGKFQNIVEVAQVLMIEPAPYTRAIIRDTNGLIWIVSESASKGHKGLISRRDLEPGMKLAITYSLAVTRRVINVDLTTSVIKKGQQKP